MKEIKLIKPKRLKPGSTLGIVATSTPVHFSKTDTIERAYDFLRGKGLKLVEAANCRKILGHAAGSIAERVSEFHCFFEDPSIDGILSYWGGYTSHQMLEYTALKFRLHC